MSRSAAAYFARRAATEQDHFAYLGDRSQGRAGAWSKDGEEFDSSRLPPRVTAIRNFDVSTHTARSHPSTVTARPTGATVIPMGDRPRSTLLRKGAAVPAAETKVATKVEVIATSSTPDTTVALAAEQSRLLSLLKAREAELERAEAERLAAEAERIRRETEAAELQAARDGFIALVRATAVEAFFYAWTSGTTHEFLLENGARADIDWLRDTRAQLEQGIARYEAKLDSDRRAAAAEEERKRTEFRRERHELAERMRVADMEVFRLLWVGQTFSRDHILNWVSTLNTIEVVRSVRRDFDLKVDEHARAKARVEAERKAEEARKAKANPRSKGFNILAYLAANQGQPVAPVAPPPTAAELAAIERRVNGERTDSVAVISYSDRQGLMLRERIQALDPDTVARLHAQRPEVYHYVWRSDGWRERQVLERVTQTWPSIERLMHALNNAKMKATDGAWVDNPTALATIKTFVAWCERG